MYSFFVTIVILILSFMPVPVVDVPDLPFHLGVDKLVHGLMYSALTVAFLWDIRRYRFSFWQIASLLLVFPIALGLLVEVAQEYLTSYRTGRADDAVANVIGVAIGLIIFFLLLKPLLRVTRE